MFMEKRRRLILLVIVALFFIPSVFAQAILSSVNTGLIDIYSRYYFLVDSILYFLILVGATAFSLVFRGVQGDRLLTQFILESDFDPYQFLAIAMLVIFMLGFFIDFIEITFIIVPVIAPILVQMDFDLLWIGIIIAMNLQTSFLTPPFGFSIFYLKGVAPPGVTTAQLYKGVIPYVLLQLSALILIILIPEISFWLLSILGA